MSTNVTICRNLNHINPPANNNKLTNSQSNLNESEWKNQEEISLMSLEKDLKTLDETVNQINLKKKSKLSKIFNFNMLKKSQNHNRPSKL
jgi:t-SNARE complex subunit (syntaxin)